MKDNMACNYHWFIENKNEKQHLFRKNWIYEKSKKKLKKIFYLRTKSEEPWKYSSVWIVWWLFFFFEQTHYEIWIIVNYVVCKTTVKFVVWTHATQYYNIQLYFTHKTTIISEKRRNYRIELNRERTHRQWTDNYQKEGF